MFHHLASFQLLMVAFLCVLCLFFQHITYCLSTLVLAVFYCVNSVQFKSKSTIFSQQIGLNPQIKKITRDWQK